MTPQLKIDDFTYHGSSGVAVRYVDFLEWLKNHSASELGNRIEAYSWKVGGVPLKVSVDIQKERWEPLPDGSGFIRFESGSKPDDCTLLDIYGQVSIRLTVPWQLSGSTWPQSARSPTSFVNVSEPYVNPRTGENGKFGVTAWVERAGLFYFELDYHSGQFLWGKQIRD